MAEHAELISVIMPARNAAGTIAASLDCLLAQTVQDWRALIVDDGSTDETAAIIAAYAARDARFVPLVGPAQGVSRARNTALPHARGRWLHFLDSDDWVLPEFYQTMLAAMAPVPDAVAAYSGYQRVMEDGSKSYVFYSTQIAENAMEAFARTCLLHCAGLLLSRDAVESVGYFDTSLNVCEDIDLYQRVARLGGRWVGVARPLAFYRTTAGSLSRNPAWLDEGLRTIVHRGFAPDPRLAGIAQAAQDGAKRTPGVIEETIAHNSLWVAMQCLAPGQGAGVNLDNLRGLPKFGPMGTYHTQIMLDGLIVGERVPAERLAARWPHFGPGLTSLITQLGAMWQDEAAAQALQMALEEKLLDYDDLAQPRQLSMTWGLRVDMQCPAPVRLPPEVRRVYAYIMHGTQIQAVKKWSLRGTISAWRWMDLIIAELQTGSGLPLRALAALRVRLIAHALAATFRQGEPRHV